MSRSTRVVTWTGTASEPRTAGLHLRARMLRLAPRSSAGSAALAAESELE